MHRTQSPLALLILSATLAGCGEAPVPEGCGPEASAATKTAMNGTPMRECAGPQAQACLADSGKKRYFCSTADLLEWQKGLEDNQGKIVSFTRDLSDVDWNPKDNGDWVTMHTAWFVVSHERDNGQGQTPPVGFSDLGDAEIFASKHGGRITSPDGLAPVASD
ncbi:nitrous oxide reductase accessory protein NosL [Salicola sp. Rm-C-2C1-2]|uniref:nitrous oxide reductase accessory protein NosL n=1 Tax=Salicola sp. Rm-C-2C1-2 TaxID=3141321 RepID=UPI0032E45D03